jgi:hypothetical protein
VRLDHLLSKEHLGRQACLVVQDQYIGECPVLVAHGWNVDYSAGFTGRRLQVLFSQEGVESMISGRDTVGHAVGCLRVRPVTAAFSAGPSELAR